MQKQLDGAQARLNNPAFTSKAPEAVVADRPRERGAAGRKAGASWTRLSRAIGEVKQKESALLVLAGRILC